MQYFADVNGAAIRTSSSEVMNSFISTTGFGKLLAKEVTGCLVSSLPTQLLGLSQFTREYDAVALLLYTP